MAVTTTWETILDRLLNEVQGLGLKASGTATSATQTVTTVDARIAAGGDNQVSTRYEGRFLYIPSATAANQLRSILNIDTVESTAVTTITVADTYDATFTDVSFYILADTPSALLAIANKALQGLHFDGESPLAHGPLDHDMQVSGASNWTATNSTAAKVTTAASVWSMAQAMTVTDGGSGGGYVESALNPVTAGESVMIHLIAKGDGRLEVLDASSNELASMEFDSETWTYGWYQLSVDVSQIKFRLVSDDASGVTTWQGAWFTREESLFRLPTGLSGNRISIEGLSVARFWETTTGEGVGQWYAGDSPLYTSLKRGTDWQAPPRKGDANPRLIRLLRGMSRSEPLFVLSKSPYSAPYGIASTLSTLASTTICPEDLIVAKMKEIIGKQYAEVWPQMAEEGRAELVAQLATYEEEGERPPEYSGFSRAFSTRR
jgi:hypothetical protein